MKSIRVYTKIHRAKQKGVMIGVRLQPQTLSTLDKWIAAQTEVGLTRPEAIRRLIETGLKALEAKTPPTPLDAEETG